MTRSIAIHAPLLQFDFGCARNVFQPARSMKKFVRRDEVALHLVEHGRIRVVFATGDRIELAAHRLMVSWGAMPHRAEWLHRDTVLYSLTIPLAWFIRWQLPVTFTQALLAGRILIETDLTQGERDQQMMRHWATLLTQPDDETRRIVLLEAEARLRRLARTGEQAARPAPGTHSSKIEGAIQLIARRFSEPLTVPQLARALGIHPNYLSALFTRETGQTLSRYLTEYRLAHACALLVSTNDKIINIAYAAGFGSVSRFHVLFRRYRRCSPRQYRLTRQPLTSD